MIMLRTERLTKRYGDGETAVTALEEVSLTVEKGEFVAVVGTSGSGKSTLLHLLGGLERATSGHVEIEGRDLLNMDEEERTIFRRRCVGFVFQSYNLIPVLNVYENIVLPIELDGGVPDQVYIDEIMTTLGLEAKRDSLPSDLSGGQQQRVAIARALASKPSIVLADEPTGSLDSRTGREVLLLIKRISEHYRQTVVMITHNEEAAQSADRIIRIEDGRLISRGQDSAPQPLGCGDDGEQP